MSPTQKTQHDAQLELLTAAYSQAKAYFNMIIMGGYAAFFALWALVKEHLAPEPALWSALFISISIVCFVAWEIFQMIASNLSLSGIAQALESPNDFYARLRKHQETESKRAMHMRTYWIVQLVLTIVFALLAAGVLMYAFISALIREYGLAC